jgi:hypothetical protein
MVPVIIIIIPLPQNNRAFMGYKLLYEMAIVRKAQYREGLYHSPVEIAMFSSNLWLFRDEVPKKIASGPSS